MLEQTTIILFILNLLMLFGVSVSIIVVNSLKLNISIRDDQIYRNQSINQSNPIMRLSSLTALVTMTTSILQIDDIYR
jgi:hypothetical protein